MTSEKLFLTWRNVVNDVNVDNKSYIKDSGKAFSEKYKNEEANKWASLYDQSLLQLTEETNKPLFLQRARLKDKLSSDMSFYRKRIAEELSDPKRTVGTVVEKIIRSTTAKHLYQF